MAVRFEPLKLSMQNVAEATGEGIPTIYAAIAAGHLESFLCGRRRFFRPAAVRAWVDFIEAQSNAGRPVVYRPRSGEVSKGGAENERA